MKMKKKTLALAIAGTSLLIGGAAIAQTKADRGPMTRDAVIERTDKAFERMDANGDGVVSPADREAHLRQRFAEADANGDGQLSEAEFAAAHEAMRAKREERREARSERRGERKEMRGGRGDRRGQGGPQAMLKRADSNGDGTVTKAEFQSAALARFDKADADGDGTVTREERRAARQAMRGQRRGQ